MSQSAPGRPPSVVRVAAALFVVKYVVLPVAVEVWPTGPGATPLGLLRWHTAVATAPFTVALFLALGYGVWQGGKGAWILALLRVAASLAMGAATFARFPSWWVLVWLAEMALSATLAVLLLLPAVSRTWFTSKRATRDSKPSPGPHTEIST